MKTKYLIVGAGISGLTFANYSDDDYLIVEKEKETEWPRSGLLPGLRRESP